MTLPRVNPWNKISNMKNLFSYMSYAAAIVLLAVGCNKEEDLLDNAVLTISANQIILEENKGEDEALRLAWDDFAPGAEYTVVIANLYSVGWNNTWQKSTNSTSLVLTVKELEEALLSIGREAGTDAYIKIKVQAAMENGLGSTIVESAVVRMYIPSIVLNTPEITANATSAVLSESSKMDKALELSWTDASIESEKVKYYEVEFAEASDPDFARPIQSDQVCGNSIFFYQLDFNLMLLKAGFELGTQTSLIYRVKAVPMNDKVKSSVSETGHFDVTSYTRPVPTNVSAIYIAGSGVESQWNIPSDVGRFEDKGNGIFEWTGTINDNGGTFKVLFNGGWSEGFRHGSNDYYWEDAQYVTDIGDNDYGVVLAKGVYKLTVDINKGTLSREIIQGERNTIGITECKGWTTVELPAINESNTVFQGNVSLTSEDGFIVVQGDGNRNWVRNTKDAEYGTRWKMSERRAKEDVNETYWFHAAETRSYKVTVDIQNNILTLE